MYYRQGSREGSYGRKGHLIQQLFSGLILLGVTMATSVRFLLQSDRGNTRFRLSGAIGNNGLVLNIQAYEMADGRPRSTREMASSIGTSDNDDDEFTDVFNH